MTDKPTEGVSVEDQIAYMSAFADHAEPYGSKWRAILTTLRSHAATQAALKKYGRHEDRCRYMATREHDEPKPCTCGFDAALNEVSP